MRGTTYIELSQTALHHNITYLRDMLGPKTTLSCVVKGNAYGHGIDPYISMLKQEGVDHFSVFSADEAYKVAQECTENDTIMIMGQIENDQIHWAIKEGVEYYVFDLDRLEASIDIARKSKLPAKIHLEIETGMNRTGLDKSNLKIAQKLISKNRKYLDVRGICTHLAGAESITNYHRIKKQKKKYHKIVDRLSIKGIVPAQYHVACSAAALRYPSTQLDLVRVGILQYGFFPTREVLINLIANQKMKVYPLKRVLSWKTTVMDIKQVKTGSFIGYGTSYLANDDMTIALIPVGYSHGFTRNLSNKGRVLIRGQRHAVVGTVNMNMLSVDVSSDPSIDKGDEVVIIGNQGDHELSVSSFSENTELVNYELLARLPSDISREIV